MGRGERGEGKKTRPTRALTIMAEFSCNINKYTSMNVYRDTDDGGRLWAPIGMLTANNKAYTSTVL